MPLATRLLAAALAAAFLAAPVVAQNVGDYQSRASGNWSAAQNWLRYNGTAWAPVATPPTGTETITVSEGDSLFVDVAVTVTGRLVNRGRVVANDRLTFGDGGVYQHDRNGGHIPLATWGRGSTVLLTGVTSTAPADRNQSFHHLVFDTPNLASNLNMGFDGVTIGGDVVVRRSGSARWQLMAASAGGSASMTIRGNVVVEGGQFTVHGTSAANTTFVVEHHGNVVVTGGNFSISRGSQPNGSTLWRLHGGDVSLENTTTQNSTSPPNNARFVFLGEAQRLTVGPNVTMQAFPIEVAEGATLDVGTTVFVGSGLVRVAPGGRIALAHPGGVAALFGATYTGQAQLEDESGYVFNGTAPQSTSSRMPAVVRDLVIDNAEGVTLTQPTTITRVLRLRRGVFDNTVPFTLGPDAEILFEGGSLLNPVSAEEPAGPVTRTQLLATYPNPARGAVTLRYDLAAATTVQLAVYDLAGRRVALLVDQLQTPGRHAVVWDTDGLAAGVYLYRLVAGDTTEARLLTLVP